MGNPTKSQIYFVQRSDGLVKIGRSTALDARIKRLKKTCGSLWMLRTIDGGAEEEAWLHRNFERYRKTGEWFLYDETMLDIVPQPPDPKVVRLDLKDVRRLNLARILTDRYNGNRGEMASALGYADSFLFRLLSKTTRSRKPIGDTMARKIERTLGCKEGWLDNAPFSLPPEWYELPDEIKAHFLKQICDVAKAIKAHSFN
jgi:hypothetical protein